MALTNIFVFFAVKRKHISEEKDFSRNLWKQTIGRVSCSSSCEDKNRQYPTHKSLPDHNVTTSNFLTKYISQNFSHRFSGFSQLFFPISDTEDSYWPFTRNVFSQVFQNSDVLLARVCKTTASFPRSFFKVYIHQHFSDIPLKCPIYTIQSTKMLPFPSLYKRYSLHFFCSQILLNCFLRYQKQESLWPQLSSH